MALRYKIEELESLAHERIINSGSIIEADDDLHVVIRLAVNAALCSLAEHIAKELDGHHEQMKSVMTI